MLKFADPVFPSMAQRDTIYESYEAKLPKLSQDLVGDVEIC